jgi:hypothetical protein
VEDVSEGNSEEERREKASEKDAEVPSLLPRGAVRFVSEFKRDTPDDQLEEDK